MKFENLYKIDFIQGFSISGIFFYSRGLKDLELDTPSIEKRFAYSFLQQLIRYVDEAHQYILEFGKLFQIIFKKIMKFDFRLN